jgi:aspartate carbamoyltransferase catalytic subunit
MRLYHVIEAQQFDRPTLLDIFHLAKHMEQVVHLGGISEVHHRILATLFF